MGSLPDSKYIIKTDGYWFVEAHDVDPSKGYISVSAKGIVNGLSNIPNDGADFGPDSYNPDYSGSGIPYTQTSGIQEAATYIANNSGITKVRLLTGAYFDTYSTVSVTSAIDIEGEGCISFDLIDGSGGYTVEDATKQSIIRVNTGGFDGISIDVNGDVVNLSNFSIDYNATNKGNGINATPSNATTNTGIAHSIWQNVTVINVGMANYGFIISNFMHCIFTQCQVNNGLAFHLIGENANQKTGNSSFVECGGYSLATEQNHALLIENIGSGSVNLLEFLRPQMNIHGNGTYYGIYFKGGIQFVNMYGLDIESSQTGSLNFMGSNGNDTVTIYAPYIYGKGTPNFDMTTSGNALIINPYFTSTIGTFSGQVMLSNINYNSTNHSSYGKPLAVGSNRVYTTAMFGQPTLSANPPVSGTAYEYTGNYDILIYLPAYASTSGTAGSVAVAIGSTSSLSTTFTQFVSGSTSSSNPDTIQLKVPAGYWYKVTTTGVTLATATVVAD